MYVTETASLPASLTHGPQQALTECLADSIDAQVQ